MLESVEKSNKSSTSFKSKPTVLPKGCFVSFVFFS